MGTLLICSVAGLAIVSLLAIPFKVDKQIAGVITGFIVGVIILTLFFSWVLIHARAPYAPMGAGDGSPASIRTLRALHMGSYRPANP